MAVQLFILATALCMQEPSEGFTLFDPVDSESAHLLDESGEVIHSWPGSHLPALGSYLRPNGNLLRTINTQAQGGGQSGGGLEERTWDGTVIWRWLYDGPDVLQHHDIEIMPNGNILMIAWEDFTEAEAIAAGRDPALLNGGVFSPDHILEIEPVPPTGANIVWEWHAWDHLVQDFDPTKANFGDPGASPELIDLNYPAFPVPASGDWMHTNSIDYHEGFDQILLSINSFNEIWVIDHSTTTAEAAGHTGGRYGMGGDILYRWGNPETYRAGDAADRMLFNQHDVNWIPEGHPGEGNILLFNNGVGRFPQFSSVDELTPPVDALGNYSMNAQGSFDPQNLAWTYTASNPGDLFSTVMSGAERLPNGNTLITSGNQGWMLEVDAAGQTVWEHVNDLPSAGQNSLFKSRRYPIFLFSELHEMSASAGGSVRFLLEAGVENAGRSYLLAASGSGTTPGTPLPGGQETIPLNWDGITDQVLAGLDGPALHDFDGILDAQGSAVARFESIGSLSASLVGETIHFAYALRFPWDFSSQAQAIEITP